MKKTVLLIAGVALVAGSAAAAKAPGPFKKNDANKDGLLNKEEYIAARIQGSKDWFVKSGKGIEAWKAKIPEPEKQFGAEFQSWDKNGDGFVDVEEFLNKGK